MSGEDIWCWEQSFLDLDVGAEDVQGIKFVQKGYVVNIISTHDVDAFMTQPDGSSLNLKIKVLFLKSSIVKSVWWSNIQHHEKFISYIVNCRKVPRKSA